MTQSEQLREKQNKHTGLPWCIDPDSKKNKFVITTREKWPNYHIADVIDLNGNPANKANAQLIVKCVNNHEKLVEALYCFMEWSDIVSSDPYHSEWTREVREKARQALREVNQSDVNQEVGNGN